MKSYRRALMSMLALLPIVPVGLSAQGAESDTIVLDEFIVEETGSALNDTVMPTDREISGLFGEATSVLEVPRSVTLISPKLMDQFNIDDLKDLEKFGAGTQTQNYYGVAGAPTIRGVKGGTYLNGMLRAFNRNEMPLSFGSLEAIEVVKGPAPADFSPTLIGGFVNLIPKSPYFDEKRGSIELELDNWGAQKVTADYGAPFLMGDIPAAFRVSITSQEGESYYDDLSNDFTSIYGAIKFRPSDGISVFFGGEYFDYRSNENAGWNRPTQQLVDSDRYVIGEPVNATNGTWRGTASRSRNPADGGGPFQAVFQERPALAIERTRAERLVPQFGNLADMTLITDTDGVEKYVYTQAYFDNGGQAVTEVIDGSTVLTDPSDFADSTDLVLFGDVTFDSNPDRTIVVKTFLEHLETEKLSSYGYAFDSEQTVLEVNASATDRTLIPNTSFTYGASARYTDAQQLQDFWDEPFSRRDISLSTISPNSVLLAGAQSEIGGNNLWRSRNRDFGTGGNVASELTQLAAFVSGKTVLLDDRLTFLTAARYEYADFDISLPSEVGGTFPEDSGNVSDASDDTDYFNWSFGPSFEVVDGLFLYGNLQKGTSVDPAQGGPIVGENNFADNELWEIGIKANLLDNRLFASLGYYEWEQSTFNGRAGASEELEGEGVELEVTWLANENLTLISSYTWQEVTRVDRLGFRTIPFSEQDWALYGGILNDTFSAGSFDGRDRGDLPDFSSPFGLPPNNTDLVYPGSPQSVFKLFAIYDFLNGFSVNGGLVYQEEFYLNFDQTIELPEAYIWSAGVDYETESWEIGFSIENLTDEEYFIGSDPVFSANTAVTKAPERTFLVSFKYKF